MENYAKFYNWKKLCVRYIWYVRTYAELNKIEIKVRMKTTTTCLCNLFIYEIS